MLAIRDFRPRVWGLSAGVAVALAAASAPPGLARAEAQLRITAMARDLDEPWALAFLPDGRFLVTERGGRLSLYPPEGGKALMTFEDFPDLAEIGQGGLLDVLVPRDLSETREILVSYARAQPDGQGTGLLALRLAEDFRSVEDVTLLFEMKPGSAGGRHFGSRLVEVPDGTVFMTIGERGAGMPAQDVTRHEGSVLHLNRDGTPASPGLFGADSLPELYSKGHRNPQGAALDGEGQLWVVEHGAQGGDELNRIEPGRNYGWPVISYGKDYDGSRIGQGTEAPGMEQPVHYWDPSIAPSGLLVHSGRMFPDWAGDFFVGSLKFDYIARLDPDAGFAEAQIKLPQTGRVRDLREAPDGAIWFLSVDDGAVYRLAAP